MKYDRIIIGAGLYGLYAALYSGKNNKDEKIIVLECESEPFSRATFINQARVHMGYHYPRSISTALKSKNYFNRFCKDYDFCIKKDFDKIYAISKNFSWTNSTQFKKFCKNASIKCEKIDKEKYFKETEIEDAFLTEEYTFDAEILKQHILKEIKKYKNIEIKYNFDINDITKEKEFYIINKETANYKTPFLLNATYGSINQIIEMLGYEKFKIKYELCEMIICKVNDKLKNVGLTVMDGPFFSIMPFGKTGYHSLTSVTFTPHSTSFDLLPIFECQKKSKGYCTKYKLGNCNNCPAKPITAWTEMSSLAKKYLKNDLEFEYITSYYSIKSILMASEIDDSRPTVIKTFTENPTFVSVLSGKINTVYDLEEILNEKK